ncbi:16359_t:CDS:1, partial [Dentiscutata heterogama]
MNQRINLFLVAFFSYLLAFAIFADAHDYETMESENISPCCKAP